jgi:hypothetical protein
MIVETASRIFSRFVLRTSLRALRRCSGQSGGRFAAVVFGPTEVGPFRFVVCHGISGASLRTTDRALRDGPP